MYCNKEINLIKDLVKKNDTFFWIEAQYKTFNS